MSIAPYKITHLTVNTSGWTQIVAPIDCEGFIINNLAGPDDLLLTHDAVDGTATTITKGNQYPYMPPRQWVRLSYRFRAGQTCGYLKSTSSSPRDAEITFAL